MLLPADRDIRFIAEGRLPSGGRPSVPIRKKRRTFPTGEVLKLYIKKGVLFIIIPH
jgi:hypothetical protein